MWLDRLAGKDSTSGSPPPHNRSYSPRRPSQLGPGAVKRPSFSPRSSSLQLGPKHGASTNLISSSGVSNGSALKQQITPPADVTDPLEVLAKITGESPTKEKNGSGENQEASLYGRPSVLAEEVDFNGLSLFQFAQELEETDNGYRDITEVVDEYDGEKDRFEDLHRSILACDEVLRSVEVSLTSFQKDLGAVSAEIETLQSRSAALNTKSESRRTVEKLLGPVAEDISISPTVIKIISEGPIDLNWVRAMDELEKRSKALKSKAQGPETIKAIVDVKPLLEDLVNKAIERIRDFFVSLIKSLRSSNINAQIIQQQSFLRYKDLYAFLVTHHAVLAEEIGQAYINTMRWYYQSHFARYRLALEKISLRIVDKQETIGSDQTAQRSNSSPKGPQFSPDPLSIDRRMEISKRLSRSALTSYLASEDHQIHFLETPFANFNLALVDNATFEFTFLTSFFPQSSSTASISQKFAAIFAPTFTIGHAFTKSLIDPSYDCLGILLCVRLNQHFAFELQRRKCPAVDSYINGTTMLLWPRFQLAMDTHTDSIRRAIAALPSSNRALTLSITSSTSQQSTAPHPLTQRFGSFLHGILTLSADAGDDSEPVARSLERLRTEFEVFLNKAGKGLGTTKRERFLANNWSLVLTIVGDVEGRLGAETKAYFEGLRG